MKIEIYDLLSNEQKTLTAKMVTDHPVSSYNQPVMIVEEWDGELMSLQNWVLAGGKIVSAEEKEKALFDVWYSLVELLPPDIINALNAEKGL